MIKRVFVFSLWALVIFCLNITPAQADEGMWLPSQIAKKIADMQAAGCKLSVEDIYNINGASIKDAIVHFNGGCTGELISNKGLLITNHHCGFSAIQSHSTVEHDYLRDGFWANGMKDELPNPGSLYVDFLEYMQDVTEPVLKGTFGKRLTESQRNAIIEKNISQIEKQASAAGKGLWAKVKPLYYGNEYYLYVYKRFTDVRLVAAPPSSIGKFGGDTDNWMWPRHTGDFSIFRIYADQNNEPADYSPQNVPYRPKRFLTISSKGVREGDFTMVYGYPGRTQEYIVSTAAHYIAKISNPAKIHLRSLILDIFEREMNASQAVRIAYAAKQANVANSWKKWQGEMKGIVRLKVVEEKEAFEAEFTKWALQGAGEEAGKAANRAQYAEALAQLVELNRDYGQIAIVYDYQREALNAVEILKYAFRRSNASGADAAAKDSVFFANYSQKIDKELFVALYNAYNKELPKEKKSPYFNEQLERFGTIERWADSLFAKPFSPNSGNLQMAEEIYDKTNAWVNLCYVDSLKRLSAKMESLYKIYMQGLMEYAKSTGKPALGKKIFYPDANSTLRVAYGKVAGYSPSDAIYYKPVSTLTGIMEKDNPDIYDYDVPQRLRELYAAGDFGKWNVEGSIPVAFIATNHTSGGNSGSPMLNAEGQLVGVNFDRVWEGTMSDVVFDPDFCRNISLDIRYVLFLLDKYAGAQWLLDELTID